MTEPREKIDYYGIIQKIKSSGNDGMLQSNLWRMLGATSREGSRIALRLVKSGLIRRERRLHKGKWTYQLISNKRPINVDSIMEHPCSFCTEQRKCGEPRYVRPETCDRLSKYVFGLVQEDPMLRKLS